MSIWFKSLNPEQIEAVSHSHGPLLILAGAGSGKTTVLVSRTGKIIHDKISIPERICVLTFTNKAALELKHRVATKLGDQAAEVWAGTFHGFGLRFLREHWREAGLPERFGVVDQSDSQSILKDLVRDHTVYDKARLNLDTLTAKISRIREYGRDSLDKSPEAAAAVVLTPKYLTRMRSLGVVDFEELLLKPLNMVSNDPKLLKKTQDRFDFLMVDEFQDTNSVQMLLLDQLSKQHQNLAVVGDDDQSIYGWRGAEIQNILNFPKRYKNCKVVRLERNYRSSEAILALANAVISNNKTRHGKVLKASAAIEGEKPELFVFDNEETEIDQVTKELTEFHRKGFRWRDMALLYRSNSQGGLMEGGLRRSQIPYKLSGGTALFDRKEARDVMAFIRCSLYPTELGFRRILNLPARGVGDKTIEAIEAMGGSPNFVAKTRAWVAANPGLPAALGISKLLQFLAGLKDKLAQNGRPAEEILDTELRELGYRAYVNQSYQDLASADSRWLSVTILGRILDGMFTKHGRSADTVQKFLDCMELRDAPEDQDGQKDQVQLMTLHACKGLEFPLVILLGLEEDLLPHGRLGHSVDEERRLLYVGVTRARQHLVLTRVEQRKRYGRLQPVAPSRFLLEIDASLFSEMRGGRPLAVGAREAMLAGLREKLDKRRAQLDSES